MNANRLFTISALTTFVGGCVGAGIGTTLFSAVSEVLLTSLVCGAAASTMAWFVVAKPAVGDVVMERN